MAVPVCSELDPLIELSCALGRAKSLVQACTGNTSIKLDDALWIKASGKSLADAREEGFFLRVERTEVGRYLSGELPDAMPGQNACAKPSIETAMHLVIPHRIVVHVHSINAIAWAVQRNGATLLHRALKGLAWCWIPYVASGASLAMTICRNLHQAPDIFVLANHGLVIGADTCEQAMSRLQEVEERLYVAPRPVPEPDPANLQGFERRSGCRPSPFEEIHSLATDCTSLRIASNGILYPCQAIFIGRKIPVICGEKPDYGCVEEVRKVNGFRPPVTLVRERCALVAPDLTCAESEMLVAFSEIVRRLQADADIAYLSEEQIARLAGAQSYRDAQISTRPVGAVHAATSSSFPAA